MANFNQSDVVQSADVVAQIKGFGSQMGIDLVIKAPTGKTITAGAGATIQLQWEDSIGNQILAQTLPAGTINDSAGLTLGTYYPAGYIFADQAAVDGFFTGAITSKIYGATIPA